MSIIQTSLSYCAVVGLGGLLLPSPAVAQVTAAGAGTAVTSSGETFQIEGGTVAGDNLFHAFGQFDLTAGQTANFLGTSDAVNIFGQILGGQPSTIDGRLQVSNSPANLYLINPAGLLLGPNVRLDLSGGFTATTADRLGFGDSWLDIYETTDYSRLIGSPDAYTFSLAEPGAVIVQGNLTVESGQPITLVGGNVIITGTLIAPGGEVTVVALPGQHQLRLGHENSLLSLEVEPVTGLTPIDLPLLLTGGEVSQPTALLPQPDGSVQVGGCADACVSVSGELVGGAIAITAPSVNLLDADLTATRSTNSIRIGGDARGQGPIFNAQQVLIDSASSLQASAVEGGQIIVWADNTARVYGSLTAHNGFIETSGQQQIDLEGARIQANGGEWLVDPTSLSIETGATGPNRIDTATIEAQLDAGTNVTITTAGPGADDGDIILFDSINQTGGGSASLSLISRSMVFLAGSQINLTSSGTLTIGLNQVNPEPVVSAISINNVISLIGAVSGERVIDLGAGIYTGETVVIDRDLTLRGAGSTVTALEGDSTYRLLEVSPGVTATIDNLSLFNGRATEGSAVLNEGNLTLSNSLLSNNIATENGGGVMNSSTLLVENTAFEGNFAAQDGGAIYADDGTQTTVRNSLFDSNQATTEQGGGIYVGRDASLFVENSDFTQNQAAQDGGGAIASNGNNSTLTILDSSLSNNTSTLRGGAVYIAGNNLTATIADSMIELNQAGDDGGGIFVRPGGTLTIRSSQIDGNQADAGGGVAALDAALTIIDSLFQSNVAASDGGGFYSGDGSQVSVRQSRFEVNQAADQGGAIYLSQGVQAGIDSTAFISNQSSSDGGAIANNGVGVLATITDSFLFGNATSEDGGAIFTARGGQTQVNSSVAEANSAAGRGGGFYVQDSSVLTIEDTTVDSNSAGVNGGGLSSRGEGQLILRNSTLSNNTTAGNGGGVEIDSGSAATDILRNLTLSGNQANEGGGVWLGESAIATVESATIANNQSKDGGGLSNDQGGTLSLQNSIVAANLAATNPDITGSFTSLGHNLVQQRGSSTGYIGSDLPNGADPRLGPLTDNGGPTRTHLIQPGSAAIDAGFLPAPPPTDQRGQPRLVGRALDIGAIELGAVDLPDGPVEPVPTARPTLPTVIRDPLVDNPTRQPNRPDLGNFVQPGPGPVLDELAFQQLERRLSTSYERYWAQPVGSTLTLQQVQEILQRARQAYSVDAAVVYPLFISASEQPGDSLTSVLETEGQNELALLLIPANGAPILRRIGITQDTVLRQARLFRSIVSDPEDAQGYQPLAQQFYSWLVAPLEADLQALSVDQLIYVPDEGLRTLPLAAMTNGDQFLTEQYGLSVVPSLSLTRFGFEQITFAKALAGGASEFTQQTALPGVAVELDRVGAIAPQSQVLFNQAFTLDNLVAAQTTFRPDVLHLATHAEFTAGDVSASYIQFWDERLSLNRLKTLDWQGIELLILSACSTALGSPEAELGFAGLAMAAGVESAVGSLWTVSDVATLALMESFYQQLNQGKGRAEALQLAQQQLLRGEVYLQGGQLITPWGAIDLPADEALPDFANFTHPFYWSAFMTVGNPWQ